MDRLGETEYPNGELKPERPESLQEAAEQTSLKRQWKKKSSHSSGRRGHNVEFFNQENTENYKIKRQKGQSLQRWGVVLKILL